MTGSKLIQNAIITPDGTMLKSRRVHDYVEHVDFNGKTYAIDGGLSYIRGIFHGDEAKLFLYDDEPQEVQRRVLEWGTRGKDGKGKLKYITIANMETEHIKAVLETQSVRDVIRTCMGNELKYRDEANAR